MHLLTKSGVIFPLLLFLSSFVLGQDSATIEGVPDTIQAGESVNLTFILDEAPKSYDAVIRPILSGPDGFTMSTSCTIPKGQTKCNFFYLIPADAASGKWSVHDFRLTYGIHDHPLAVNNVDFQVIARSDLNYPTSATVSLNLSQVQLFRTEAIRIQGQIEKLTADLKAEPQPLGKATIDLLRDRVERELETITKTESQFKEASDKSEEGGSQSAGIFFDDLRLSYTDVLNQLPEQHSESIAEVRPVSLKTAKSTPKANSIPLLASGVLAVFNQNAIAYSLAASSQSLTFNLEVNSNPQGAAISYRRRGDALKPNSNPTNCTLKSLALAI